MNGVGPQSSSGFPAVALFATLLGIATVVHWEKFSHGHVAFWLWAGLYFTAPFLVVGAWLANTTVAAAPRADEQRIGAVARWAVGAVGLGALATGILMFLSPATMTPIWPWSLTPLTCRVVGAIFCLGVRRARRRARPAVAHAAADAAGGGADGRR